MDNRLSVMQWNCQGMQAKYESLKILIEEKTPICISLQETLLKQKILCPRDYSFYHTGYDEQRDSHGCAVLIRKDVAHTTLPLQTDLQAVAVQMFIKRKYTICSIYLPPNRSSHDLLRDLRVLVSQLPRPFLILGDFNGRHPLWGDVVSNSRGNAIYPFIEEQELAILNSGEPTHYHVQTGTFSVIDLSLCSPDCFLDFSWYVMDEGLGSDHFPIFIDIVDEIATPRSPRWLLDKANWALFRTLTFLEIDIEDFQSVDDALDLLSKVIIDAAQKTIPRTSGKFKRRPVPWWNLQCRIARKAMRAAFTRYRKNQCSYYLICFKKARARFRYQVKQAKRQSWVDFISKINWKTSLSEVWNKIRKITGKYVPTAPPVLKINGNLVTKPEDVSEAFANHFAKVSSKNPDSPYCQERIQEENKILDFTSLRSESYNLPFTLQEFLSALSSCSDSAPGADDITYSMIKNLPVETQKFLLSIINKIWKESAFPEAWEIAILLAFLKPKKDGATPSNYRPIALTSCICKLMEKMVNVRLMWVLERKGLITPAQCGFRKMHSCTDILIRLETSICEAFISKKHHVSVFFDLEKAYDTAWRYGILKTLHDYEFRGELPLFIEAFLKHRRFKVKVGNAFSSFHSQEEGVPQGSVLSVTLFALSINGITSVIPKDVMFSLFVDDLSLSFAASRMVVAERKMQLAINRIIEWAEKRGFKFSTSKTVAVHFCNIRGVHPDPDLYIHGQRISCKEETRFLGLLFDRRLTWMPHLKDLKVRCLQAMNILRVLSHTSWGADRKHLLILYKALVASKLAYGCEVYSSATKSRLCILDSVHNAGIRIASGAFKSSPIPSLLVDAGEMPLDSCRQVSLVRYWHRIQRIPKSPTCQAVFKNKYFNFYESHPRFPKPFGFRVFKILEEYFIPKVKLWPVKYSVVPPWKLPSVEYCKCFIGRKQEVSPEVLRISFLEHLLDHEGSTLIFTDGSKSDVGVGYGVVSPDFNKAGRLPDQSSIFTAECYGILIALKEIASHSGDDYVICSDSLSVLQAIGHFNLLHPIILEILEWLHLLKISGNTVSFCWSPAHVGVTGNEAADSLAKAAASRCDITNCALPVNDMFPVVRSAILDSWKFTWELEHQKMKEIANSIFPWKYSPMTRQREVILSRLRIGHTRLTHGFLMSGDHQPFCEDCLVPLTVRHLMIECPSLSDQRERYFPSSCKGTDGGFSLAKILGVDFMEDRLFGFIDAIDILNKI